MGTMADAKVAHNYKCYNGDFIGCLHFIGYLPPFHVAAFMSQRSRIREATQPHS